MPYCDTCAHGVVSQSNQMGCLFMCSKLNALIYAHRAGDHYMAPVACPLDVFVEAKKATSASAATWNDPTQYWRSKEGLVTRITDLKDDHLRNIIAMLERANPMFDLWMECPPADPALDSVAAELTDWESDHNVFDIQAKLAKIKIPNSDLAAFRQYQALVKEAEKRGLLPCTHNPD